jgi:PKD repeat protein
LTFVTIVATVRLRGQAEENQAIFTGCSRRIAALAAALAACAVVAAPAPAVIVRRAHGHFLGVTPRRGVSPASLPGSLAAARAPSGLSSAGNLNYNGGPVLHSSDPYLIFWTPSGESMPTGFEALLERYFTGVAADSSNATNVYAVDRQFTDSAGFADYQQNFSVSSQSIVDTQQYPPLDATNCQDTSEPTCLTDAQLQSEVQRLITADGLPGDGSTSTQELSRNAPIYFVVLPADVNVCFGGGGGGATTCSDNAFCAYHSSFTDTSSDSVLYAAIPTVNEASNPKSCQYDGNTAVQEPNGNVADVVIKYMSHEDNETITDPLGTAWWNTTSGNEDGDNCNFYGSFDPAKGYNPNAFAPTLGGSAGTGNPYPAGNLYNQLIDSYPYYTQSEWSNGDGNCEMQPTAGTITPSFTVPAGPNAVGSALSFDPASSTSTNSLSSETWDFGDGTTPVFHVGSPAAVSHTYAHAGTYDVKLTLVDNRGNLARSSQSISVYDYPSAAFLLSPSLPLEGAAVTFDGSRSSDPDAGVTISAYAWNFGDGTTATVRAPNHTYTRYGTYTVKLTVTNSVGLKSTAQRQVIVADEPPTARFAIATAHPAARVAVRFNGSSSDDPDGTTSSYAWNFGDGASGTGATPSHTYRLPGTYSVSLTVRDSSGLTGTKTEQLVVVRGSRITRIAVVTKKRVSYLLIRVDGPGRLFAGPLRFDLPRAETLRMRVALTRTQESRLRRTNRLKVKVLVRFTPAVGAPARRVVTVVLRR